MVPTELENPRSSSTVSNAWSILRTRLQLPSKFLELKRPVVTINAPAGYGKSTLLSHWQDESSNQDCRVIKVTVDPDDYEGDQLIIDLAEAVVQRDKKSSASLLDAYGNQGKLALIKALLAELDVHDNHVALYIDDVHELLNAPAESVLRLLLRYQPDRLMLVFSGRAVPTEATSQALLEGRLYRLTAKDLALTEDEIKPLLQQHNIEPREKLMRHMLERTRGWPAAVRLIALALEDGRRSPDDFVGGLQDEPQALTDYLNEVLLSQLPDHIHEFLLQISLLRAVSVPLAVAATGREDAGQLLDELERRALPITRRGGTEPTYVLHPLVRDFLLTLFRRVGAETLSQTRDAAYQWLITHDRIDTAIEVCLDADDLKSAVALINQHASLITQKYGRHTTFLYWVNKLPQAALSKNPEIRLRQAWSLGFVRRHEEAEAIRSDLEREYLQGNGSSSASSPCSEEFRIALDQSIDLQRCVEAALRDQAVDSSSRTTRWLSRWPDADPFDRATAHCVLAFSAKALGDFQEGIYHAHTAQGLAHESHAYYPLAWAQMLGASNLVKQGQYRQALLECGEYLPELELHLGSESPAVTMLYAIQAGVLYEFNRLSESRDSLGMGLTALVEQSSTDPIIMGYVTLARLQNIQGQYLEALATLAEGEALGRAKDLPRLAITLGAERLVLLLRSGELKQAKSLWQELQQGYTGNTNFRKTLEDKASRICARIALLKGDFEEAYELVAPALRHAKRTGQKRKHVELLLIQALALHQRDDTRKALSLFGDAIGLGLTEQYIRVFVDEGEPIQCLLSAYRDDSTGSNLTLPTSRYLDEIAAALKPKDIDNTSRPESNTQALVEPLTARELQIVSKMQSGLPNRKLADALFISEGTLKWHLQNIYGKLGVGNRLSAVTKAQELHLLDSA